MHCNVGVAWLEKGWLLQETFGSTTTAPRGLHSQHQAVQPTCVMINLQSLKDAWGQKSLGPDLFDKTTELSEKDNDDSGLCMFVKFWEGSTREEIDWSKAGAGRIGQNQNNQHSSLPLPAAQCNTVSCPINFNNKLIYLVEILLFKFVFTIFHILSCPCSNVGEIFVKDSERIEGAKQALAISAQALLTFCPKFQLWTLLNFNLRPGVDPQGILMKFCRIKFPAGLSFIRCAPGTTWTTLILKWLSSDSQSYEIKIRSFFSHIKGGSQKNSCS